MTNIGVLGTSFQIFSNYLSILSPGTQISDVPANDNARKFKPDSWIFSIWGLIYVSLFIGFYSGKDVFNNDNKLENAYIIASITNALWILLWTNKKIRLALLSLGTLSGSLLYVLLQGNYADEFNLIENAISLYSVWAFNATGLNLNYVLNKKPNEDTGNIITLWSSSIQILWQLYLTKVNPEKAKNSLAFPIVGILLAVSILTRLSKKRGEKTRAYIILIVSIISLGNQLRLIVNTPTQTNLRTTLENDVKKMISKLRSSNTSSYSSANNLMFKMIKKFT